VEIGLWPHGAAGPAGFGTHLAGNLEPGRAEGLMVLGAFAATSEGRTNGSPSGRPFRSWVLRLTASRVTNAARCLGRFVQNSVIAGRLVPVFPVCRG